jgi:predicted CoA-binding protein
MRKKTLVIGASLKSSRYSNMAVQKLSRYGHEVYAVGLRNGEIGSIPVDTFENAFAKAKQHTSYFNTITLYIGPKHLPAYFDYIIQLKPARVIFNPGTENSELYKLLEENGIGYEIACTLVLLSTNQY